MAQKNIPCKFSDHKHLLDVSPKSPFTSLPPELIWTVLQNLNNKELKTLALTCKLLNSHVNKITERSTQEWNRAISGKELSGHAGPVIGVAFSPSGKHLASWAYDKTIRLWDAKTFQPCYTLSGHSHPVTDVQFSPHSQYLLSLCSKENYFNLWNTTTGGLITRYVQQKTTFKQAIFCPFTRRVFMLTDKGYVYVCCLKFNGQTQKLFDHGTIQYMTISPTTPMLATIDLSNTIALWDTDTGTLIKMFKKPLYCSGMRQSIKAHLTNLSFSPKGTYLVANFSHFIALVRLSDNKEKRYKSTQSSCAYFDASETLFTLTNQRGMGIFRKTSNKPPANRPTPLPTLQIIRSIEEPLVNHLAHSDQTFAWHPDSRTIAVALTTGVVAILQPRDLYPYCPDALS